MENMQINAKMGGPNFKNPNHIHKNYTRGKRGLEKKPSGKCTELKTTNLGYTEQ